MSLPGDVVAVVAGFVAQGETPGNRLLHLLAFSGVSRLWRQHGARLAPGSSLAFDGAENAGLGAKATLARFRRAELARKRAAFLGASRLFTGYAELSLSGDAVTDEVLANIAAVNGRRLTSLRLVGARQVTDAGVAALVCAAPKLRSLVIEDAGAGVRGAFVPALLQCCRTLEALHIEGADAFDWGELSSAAAWRQPSPPQLAAASLLQLSAQRRRQQQEQEQQQQQLLQQAQLSAPLASVLQQQQQQQRQDAGASAAGAVAAAPRPGDGAGAGSSSSSPGGRPSLSRAAAAAADDSDALSVGADDDDDDVDSVTDCDSDAGGAASDSTSISVPAAAMAALSMRDDAPPDLAVGSISSGAAAGSSGGDGASSSSSAAAVAAAAAASRSASAIAAALAAAADRAAAAAAASAAAGGGIVPAHRALRRLHVRFANVDSLQQLIKRCPGLLELQLDGPAFNIQAAAAACPSLRRLSYLASSSLELDAALFFLQAMPALRGLEVEARGIMLSTEQLRVIGLLPLRELALDSHAYRQQPSMPRPQYSHLDNEGVKGLVDSICSRMRAELMPLRLSLCGATALKQEAVSALLRLPILTAVDTGGCVKLTPMDRMRLVAKVKAGQGMLDARNHSSSSGGNGTGGGGGGGNANNGAGGASGLRFSHHHHAL